MLTYLQRIEWFIGLVLLQVLVLNHMPVSYTHLTLPTTERV